MFKRKILSTKGLRRIWIKDQVDDTSVGQAWLVGKAEGDQLRVIILGTTQDDKETTIDRNLVSVSGVFNCSKILEELDKESA